MSERECSVAKKIGVLTSESLVRSGVVDSVLDDPSVKQDGPLFVSKLKVKDDEHWILSVSEIDNNQGDKCLLSIINNSDVVLLSKIVSYSQLVGSQLLNKPIDQLSPLDWPNIRANVLSRLDIVDKDTPPTRTTVLKPTRASDARNKGSTRPGDMPQFDDEYEVINNRFRLGNDTRGPLPGINLPADMRPGYGDSDLYPLGQKSLFNNQGGGNGMIFPLRRDDPNQQEQNRGPDFMPGAKYDPPFGQGPSFGQGSSFPPL